MLDSKPKILFMLSGSIACFKACSVISSLVKEGFDVQTVASRSALEFVGNATLEGLTGKPVLSSTFEHGRAMDHIHLMNEADLVVLCPASANTLNKLASGIGDDLLSTMFLAFDFKKPFLVFPAMNSKMYAHPSTKASMVRLENWGLKVFGTGTGPLACGEEGEGRLWEPEDIFRSIKRAMAPKLAGALEVLITSGGTQEAIDGVRAITNTSTGATGAQLADVFSKAGHNVTLLRGKKSAKPQTFVKELEFEDFESLEKSLFSLIGSQHFDVVIHLAAVSDFSLKAIESGGKSYGPHELTKLDSRGDVILTLKPNAKLVNHIRTRSINKDVKLVAFKLLSESSDEEREQAVKKLRDESQADFVVANDTKNINSTYHLARIYDRKGFVSEVDQKEALAKKLLSYLEVNP